MKTNLEEILPGEFFEYKQEQSNAEDSEGTESVYELYQKLTPNPHYNAILITKGQPCNLYPKASVFKKVSLEIKVERTLD